MTVYLDENTFGSECQLSSKIQEVSGGIEKRGGETNRSRRSRKM